MIGRRSPLLGIARVIGGLAGAWADEAKAPDGAAVVPGELARRPAGARLATLLPANAARIRVLRDGFMKVLLLD
jgi:hypothetical protein